MSGTAHTTLCLLLGRGEAAPHLAFCHAVDAVLGALADGDTDHDFLGPVQPDAVMQKVAEGTQPVSKSTREYNVQHLP